MTELLSQIDKKICRLCLEEIPDNQFLELDAKKSEMILTLVPELCLSVCRDPVLCEMCTKVLQECYYFKSTCLITEKHIRDSLPHTDPPAKIDLKTIVYNKSSEFPIANSISKVSACRTCLMSIEGGVYAYTDEDEYFTERFKRCIPELDVNLVVTPLLCEYCYESLESTYGFINQCLDVDKKIQSFCETQGTNSSNQVNLYSVWRHVHEPNTKPAEGNSSEQTIISTDEDNVSYLDFSSVNFEKNSEGYYTCQMCDYQTKLGNYFKAHQLIHLDTPLNTTVTCPDCPFKTQVKLELIKHILVHKNINNNNGEAKIYKCLLCEYASEKRHWVSRHMITHKNKQTDLYYCIYCPYTCKSGTHLSQHMVVHKQLSEVNSYDCPVCPYKSKWQGNLEKHIDKHTDDEINNINSIRKAQLMNIPTVFDVLDKAGRLFECPECEFTTKTKFGLQKHVLVIHRNEEEVEMFYCGECSYRTKWKHDLKKHAVVHKDLTEIKTFDCELCPYKGRRRRNLNSHMLTHEKTGPAVYQCPICPFSINWKPSLKRHMIKHENTANNELKGSEEVSQNNEQGAE